MVYPFIVLGIIIILTIIFKSPIFKGWIGEKFTQLTVSIGLDESVYNGIQNVTIPDGIGTTQIDHVYVSQYGIFVIETKNYKGWIFGTEKDRYWTQKLFKKSHRFQNPIWQNKKHIRCLSELLSLPEKYFHSVIVFCPNAELKTEMPANVVSAGKRMLKYINSFQEVCFSDEQVTLIIQKIIKGRLQPTRKTHKEHVRYLKEKHENKETA